MSLTVNFYNFSKRKNSTKRPTTAAASFSCTLKEDCNLLTPQIMVHNAFSTAPTYNYCYIDKFSRYYWVNDWTWSEGHWSATLQCDALASWKTAIGQKNAYVIRSASEMDGDVFDSMYVTKASHTQRYTNMGIHNNWFVDSLSGGFYMLGVASNRQTIGETTYGSVDYYMLDQKTYNAFSDFLLGDVGKYIYFEGTDLNQALCELLFNPYQYVKSIRWFPFSPTSVPYYPNLPYTTTISMGYWSYDLSLISADAKLYKLTNPLIESYASFLLPQHPLADDRGAYMNMQPYTEHTLNLPLFGNFTLDGSLFANEDIVIVKMATDLITGECTMVVVPGAESQQTPRSRISGIYRTVSNASISVDLFASSVSGVLNAALGVGQTAINIATENYAGAASSIVGAANSIKLGAQGGASNSGGLASFTATPTVTSIFYDVVDDDPAENGYPLMKNRQISSLSGFIKVQDGEVLCPATNSELDSIKSALENGFFYE